MTDKQAIKACKGHYSARLVARHFNVSHTTVCNIWRDPTITPTEAPWIAGAPYSDEDILDTWRVLQWRGVSVEEAATYMNVSKSRLYQLLKEVTLWKCS